MLQPINFTKSGLRYAHAKKETTADNKQLHFFPLIGKPCSGGHIPCIILGMQVQDDSLDNFEVDRLALRFVVDYCFNLWDMRKENVTYIYFLMCIKQYA